MINFKILVKILIIYLAVLICTVQNATVNGSSGHSYYFCKDNKDIRSNFDYVTSSGYGIVINKTLPVFTEIRVKLDSGSTVILNNDARFSADKDTINNIFTFIIVKDVDLFIFKVQGRFAPNHPPYVISLKINGVENCNDPDRTYFQKFPLGVVELFGQAPDKFCGRRRINRRYTELIVGGSDTNAGDWPWHAAIMRLHKFTLKYTCGGTLISQYLVLTAAHCATVNGEPMNPELLNVILGKYSLVAKDIALQEKNVFKVIAHDEFNHRTLNNDIALLKLATEAVFNNYVQPACLWFDGIYEHLGPYGLSGTVVGWGFDRTDDLSPNLKSANMPKMPDTTCIRYNPVFYSNFLNGKRFCAGNQRGTSACNGDSGGGFMVFVQDDPYVTIPKGIDYIDGAWYVKGVVSISLARPDASICDPNAFTVFTDVAVYRDWILSHTSTYKETTVSETRTERTRNLIRKYLNDLIN